MRRKRRRSKKPQSPQLVWSIADLILKIQITDSSGKKFFKGSCSILDKKKLNDIFKLLKMKYGLNIPKNLKEDSAWALG